MANLDRFNEMLSSFDEPEQTSQTILQSLVQYEEVLSNRQQFRDHSPAADDLHQWVLNIIRYSYKQFCMAHGHMTWSHDLLLCS